MHTFLTSSFNCCKYRMHEQCDIPAAPNVSSARRCWNARALPHIAQLDHGDIPG